MAELLSQGKETSAKIRVENIIRQDIIIELMEFLELYCELLLARIGLLLESTVCDSGLEEAVKTIIYSASFIDVKELVQVKEILIYKFGKEFGMVALENTDHAVPDKVVSRCSVRPPSEELVVLYLSEIAKAYKVPFSEMEPEEEPVENEEDNEKETGISLEDKAPITVKPPHMTSDNPHPEVSVPKGVNLKKAKKPEDDFDELRKRFDALKK